MWGGTSRQERCTSNPFSLVFNLLSPQALQNSLRDVKDVGLLQVKVLKAVDLLAADFSGREEHKPLHSLLFPWFCLASKWASGKTRHLISRSNYRVPLNKAMGGKAHTGAIVSHNVHFPQNHLVSNNVTQMYSCSSSSGIPKCYWMDSLTVSASVLANCGSGPACWSPSSGSYPPPMLTLLLNAALQSSTGNAWSIWASLC